MSGLPLIEPTKAMSLPTGENVADVFRFSPVYSLIRPPPRRLTMYMSLVPAKNEV